MINLDYRKTRFKKIFSSKKFKDFESLIAFGKIDNNYFLKIKNACINFIIASFQKDLKIHKNIKNSNEKIRYILKNINNMYSITPNGFIIPKSHSYKEYNKLLKLYYNLFNKFGLKSKIDFWQEPIGICVKYYDNSKKEQKKSNRIYHQTSNSHIESWAGYSNLGINTLLPVLGNTIKNYTEFYKPKNKFDETEVSSVTKKNYKEIKSKNYFKKPFNKKIKNFYKCGTLICWDNIVLHNTKIKDKFSFRIFLVNQFIPKLKKKEQKFNRISKYRKSALLKHQLVANKKSFLKFKKVNDYKFKSTLGGKRAAYNYVLVK